MAALLANPLSRGARTARDLLLFAGPELALPPTALPAMSLTQELQARIEAARDETLEYYCTH